MPYTEYIMEYNIIAQPRGLTMSLENMYRCKAAIVIETQILYLHTEQRHG